MIRIGAKAHNISSSINTFHSKLYLTGFLLLMLAPGSDRSEADQKEEADLVKRVALTNNLITMTVTCRYLVLL